MAKEINRPKKCYVTVKSVFTLLYVQVKSTLRKQRSAGAFCTSNSETNKELTKCHRPREYGLNIIMRRAPVQANIWHPAMVLNPTCLARLTLAVKIPRPKASAGSLSGCTSSGLSAAARQV